MAMTSTNDIFDAWSRAASPCVGATAPSQYSPSMSPLHLPTPSPLPRQLARSPAPAQMTPQTPHQKHLQWGALSPPPLSNSQSNKLLPPQTLHRSQQQLPDSLRQPDSLPPPSRAGPNRARLGTAESVSPTPGVGVGRARLGTADAIMQRGPHVVTAATTNVSSNRPRLNTGDSAASLPIPASLPSNMLPPLMPTRAQSPVFERRARLDTTESAATLPAFNISVSPNPNPIPLKDTISSQYQSTRAIGNARQNNNIQSQSLKVNASNLLFANNIEQIVDTPLANNRSEVDYGRGGERQELQSPLLPQPEVDNIQHQQQHRQQWKEQNGENANQNEVPATLPSGKKVEEFANPGDSKIREQTLIKPGKKKIELTASSAVMEQIVASATLNNDDAASSDVSSLSDTISFQRSIRKAKPNNDQHAVAEKSGAPYNIKPTSSMGIMASLIKQKTMKRLNVRSRDNKDTVTTAATGESRESTGHSIKSHRTLETIDRSLEHRLFKNGKMDGRRHIRSEVGHYHLDSMPSPLGAEMNREMGMFTPHRMRNNLHDMSPMEERGLWGSTPISHYNGSPASQSSGRRHHHAHDTSPGNFGSPGPSAFLAHYGGIPMAQQSGRHHRRSASHGNEYDNNQMGIKDSWLIPSLQPHPSNSPGRSELQSLRSAGIPLPEDDLIDVTHDEPVDPFSGLIGMPASFGCEKSIISGDGDSYTGMNVFGTRTAPSISVEPTSVNNMHGSNHDALMLKSGRPPLIEKRTTTTSTLTFDPLVEGEEGMMELHHNQSNSVCSSPSLRRPPPSAGPPRRYKDDPMLSKSRYRSPLHHFGSSQRQKSTKKLASRHRRSSSVGASANSSDMMAMMESSCMFGSIALSETVMSPMTPLEDAPQALNSVSMEWDGSIANSHHSMGHASIASIGRKSTALDTSTPGSATLTPTGSSIKDAGTIDNNALDEGNEDDDSSYGSFSEEYNRPEQKHKVVAKEVKHIIGKVFPVGKPMVKVGRKLLRVDKEAVIKRSEGLLA